MHFNFSKSVLIFFVIPLLTSGCAVFWLATGAAAGAGGIAYVTGELRATDQVEMEAAYDAATVALEELQFGVLYQEKDAINARIEASTAADKDVRIKLEKVGDELTEIRIRVGVMGNRSLSERILAIMRENY